jgi:DNA-binding transcriptional MerR regulator
MPQRTIKQVSDLTGISIRMLRYYDKIGLLKPSSISEAGYRLYGEEALEVIQQILFYKELDFALNDIKGLLSSTQYNKEQALNEQKELLIIKRNHLDELIALLEQKQKGTSSISFKEFDMTEYFTMLENFKQEHADDIIKYYGSSEDFSKLIDKMKSKELSASKMAIKQFGSIDAFTKAIKNNLDNLPSIMEGFSTLKQDSSAYLSKSNELMEHLASDTTKDPSCPEIQQIVQEMDDLAKETSKIVKMDMGNNYWGLMADLYLTNQSFMHVHDKKYGNGATRFIGEALRFYSEMNKKQ